MRKNKKLVEFTSHSEKWWGKEDVEWAVKDKDGGWWLIAGSEFPEKKTPSPSDRTPKRGRNNSLVMVLSALLGASMGLNTAFVYFLFKIIL
jgi:hypothetical protein